jgi:RecB family exonuclease
MRLSYSGIDTYQTCGLKYKFREIDKLPEPKSKEAVFGTLIHSTMKFIHDPTLLSPTLEQALDHFSKNWNSVGMLQRYYADNQPSDARVIALESRFGIEIDGGDDTKHVLSGIIDRIDKTEDGYEIIDYKTARKMPSQDKVDHDLQLTIYLRAFLER